MAAAGFVEGRDEGEEGEKKVRMCNLNFIENWCKIFDFLLIIPNTPWFFK